MENIVKEALQTQLKKLREELGEMNKTFTKDINDRAMKCLKNMGSEFNTIVEVRVGREEIDIQTGENKWSDVFSVIRRRDYDFETRKYKIEKPTIKWGSTSKATDSDLDYIIMVGELAKLIKTKHIHFDCFVVFMDEFCAFEKEKQDPIYDKISKLEREIKNIEQNEKTVLFDKILKRGFVELPLDLEKRNPLRLYYGSGKYDKIRSRRFEWVENKGGKTFEVKHLEENVENDKVISSKLYIAHDRVKRDYLINLIGEAIRLGAE